MSKFEQLEAFVAVVDQQTFTAAANHLGVAKSMVSRRVNELEKRLGVQLMQRTTRRMSLTDSGRHFYQRALALLADLDDAEQFVTAAQGRLSGKIKLAVPLSIGIAELAEPVALFMLQHAEIKIDIDLNDRQIDLVAEGFDMAVRVGQLADSSLVARKLANVNFAVCASPEYLANFGEPSHPSELKDHQVMLYTNSPLARQWSFYSGSEQFSPKVSYRLSANNGEMLASAARFGLGIAAGPQSFLQPYIDRGELVPILCEFPWRSAGMYAVYPPGRLVSRRVKSFSDFLFDYFRDREI